MEFLSSWMIGTLFFFASARIASPALPSNPPAATMSFELFTSAATSFEPRVYFPLFIASFRTLPRICWSTIISTHVQLDYASPDGDWETYNNVLGDALELL